MEVSYMHSMDFFLYQALINISIHISDCMASRNSNFAGFAFGLVP